jgi:hypothetical protein
MYMCLLAAPSSWQVNTKVDMRFDIAKADWIPEEVKDAIRQKVSFGAC